MVRARFEISPADFLHAFSYLTDGLRSFRLELETSASRSDASRELAAISGLGSAKRIEMLNKWCSNFLSQGDWRKLKTAIRKRRQRWKNYEDTKTITVSAKVHQLLLRIAERDNVTFNEVLEHSLAKIAKSPYRIKGTRAK
jgi:macrodomain Ter protein organizer (MatP/YcbG family)